MPFRQAAAIAQAPAVLVYRDQLLRPSETFIRNQGEGLCDFRAHYLGRRAISGLSLPAERTLIIERGTLGKWRGIQFKLWGSAPALERRLRRINPILLHAHFGPGGTEVLRLTRLLGIPLVVTFHGYDVSTTDKFANRASFSFRSYLRNRQALKREGALFIAVSRYIQSVLARQNFPPDRTVLHYIGVDTDFFMPDPGLVRQPVVLFVGRLVEIKGCEYLIRAMSEIQKQRPETELAVVGDGPLRTRLEELAANTLCGKYQFYGTKAPEEVRDLMNRASVFSVPSVTAESGATEAFGLAFAEAQAMGLPVVATTSGGIPEAVANGRTGFLVQERAWEPLADRILLLLRNRDIWQQFSAAGIERVREHFDFQKQCIKLEQLYRNVLLRAGYSFSNTRQMHSGVRSSSHETDPIPRHV